MKKLFLSIVVTSVISSSLMAVWLPGKVGQLELRNDGSVVCTLIKDAGSVETRFVNINATGDSLKTFIAALMTAKAADVHVELNIVDGAWTKVRFD